MKPFFIKIPNFWAWANNLGGQILWLLGRLGYFRMIISAHFGTVGSLSMFSINQPLFPQKTKPLYPNPQIFIWDWDLIWAENN